MTLAATRGFEKHHRPTRKAEVLVRMETCRPWAEFCVLIEPHYPKAGNGQGNPSPQVEHSRQDEHPFLTLKRLWGFAKVRYRGLAKNANRAFVQKRIQTMLAMINLSKWGSPLTGAVRPA